MVNKPLAIFLITNVIAFLNRDILIKDREKREIIGFSSFIPSSRK